MKKLFSAARGRSTAKAVDAVVVCIDRAHSSLPAIREQDVEDLATQLAALVAQHQLGDYDGCDDFSSESRLYFFSHEPDRLAGVATELVAGLPWRERVHVRVSLDPLGLRWRRTDT